MVRITLGKAELVLAIAWVIARGIACLRRGRVDLRREAILLAVYLNLAVVLRFAFFPMHLSAGRVRPLMIRRSGLSSPRLNWVPFVNLFDYTRRRTLLTNVLGNMALFLPSGFALPLAYPRLNRLWKAILAGAAMSLCIEILQLPVSSRVSDVDDLILNTVGFVLGYGLCAALKRLHRAKK